jgi:hypothetical protein
MLDEYVEHLIDTDNRSLLARIYGVFTVKNNYYSDLDIMIMQNTVQLFDKRSSKLTFDLKGSTSNRKVVIPYGKINSLVLKDQNYLEMNSKSQVVTLTIDQMIILESIIKKDSAFLRHHGFMDYSLLLVVEPMP